jgi:DnaA family protein
MAADVIWLCGNEGVGKTHLLQAVCAAEPRRAAYLPLGESNDSDPGTLEGLGELAVIALDDIDSIAADPAWNSALFELYNERQDLNGRLLVAASVPPGRVEFQLPDLASRFRAANVFRLAPLDDAGLLEALRLQAQARGLELSEAAGRYLLTRVKRDMPGLSAWLARLDNAALASQRKLTIPLIRDALSTGA